MIVYEVKNRAGQTLRWVPSTDAYGPGRAAFVDEGRPVRYYSPEGAERGRDLYVGIGPNREPLGEVVPVAAPDHNDTW
jgi:hypothetical protein